MLTRKAICLGALAALAACAKTTPVLSPSFSTPTGLATARFYLNPDKANACDLQDSNWHDGLFVANSGEDAVQLLELGSDLSKLDFVYSPANYFPLRIPAGPGPTDLAGSYDGRFVVVLDTITESLRLIDTGASPETRRATR